MGKTQRKRKTRDPTNVQRQKVEQKERNTEKYMKKTKWLNHNNTDKQYTYPIFCPITPESTLAKRWRKVAEDTSRSSRGRVTARIVEQVGRSLRSVLCKSAPQEEKDYGNEECRVCCSETNKRLVCTKQQKEVWGMKYSAQIAKKKTK